MSQSEEKLRQKLVNNNTPSQEVKGNKKGFVNHNELLSVESSKIFSWEPSLQDIEENK